MSSSILSTQINTSFKEMLKTFFFSYNVDQCENPEKRINYRHV